MTESGSQENSSNRCTLPSNGHKIEMLAKAYLQFHGLQKINGAILWHQQSTSHVSVFNNITRQGTNTTVQYQDAKYEPHIGHQLNLEDRTVSERLVHRSKL